MRIRFLGPALLLGMSVAMLAGCTSGSGIPAIHQQAQKEDRWPGDQALLSDSGMAVDTSRLLASHNDLDYYVATSEDQKMACLFKFEHADPSEGAMGGCGGLAGTDFIVEFSTPEGHTALVRNDAEIRNYESKGWQQIHENIFIKGP